MLTPIISIRTTDKMIKIRPMMAEEIISLPALSLSGMPADVVIIKVP